MNAPSAVKGKYSRSYNIVISFSGSFNHFVQVLNALAHGPNLLAIATPPARGRSASQSQSLSLRCLYHPSLLQCIRRGSPTRLREQCTPRTSSNQRPVHPVKSSEQHVPVCRPHIQSIQHTKKLECLNMSHLTRKELSLSPYASLSRVPKS